MIRPALLAAVNVKPILIRSMEPLPDVAFARRTCKEDDATRAKMASITSKSRTWQDADVSDPLKAIHSFY